MSKKYNIIKKNFVKVYEREIDCDIPIEKLYVHNVDQVTHYIYNIDDITDINLDKIVLRERFQNLPIKKTIYVDKHIRFSKYHCDCIFYPFTEQSEHFIDKLSDNSYYDTYIPFFKNDPESQNCYLSASIIVLIEKSKLGCVLSYHINPKLYEAGIMNKRVNNRSGYLIDLLERDAIQKRNKRAESELTIILNESCCNNLESTFELKELKESVKLYNYQKADVCWMTNIKNDIDNNRNTIIVRYNDYYNMSLQDPNNPNETNEYILLEGKLINAIVASKVVNISYIGGNIISDIGTGKTIITLSYIVKNFTNKYDCYINFENNLCNYFYKRGKNKGYSCDKEKISSLSTDELYCKEHHKTMFIDKRKTIFNKETIDKTFNLRDIIVEVGNKWNKKKLFKSNASLILCPNQLCDQWVREYYECFKQNDQSKRVLLIVTYDQYCNITFGEMLFADIIILSYDFLKNANYLKRGNLNRWNPTQNIVEILDSLDDLDYDIDYDSDVDTSELRILDKFDVRLNKLDNFYYESIYLDEFHEIKDILLNESLNKFSSKYRWNITATPFANGLNSFINGINNITDENFSYIYDKIDVDTVKSFSQLYRRNTKESIKDEYTSVTITDNIKLLEFTEQERRIYDAHSLNKSTTTRDFLIKLCCDTSIDNETKNLVKNCKTFDEIESVILNNNKRKIVQLKKVISEYTRKVTVLEEQVNLGFVPILGFHFEFEFILTMHELKIVLGNVRRTLTINKKEYNEINRTYTFLKKALENIKTIETCPICLDDIDDIAITKCGHKFCKECIHEYIDAMYNKDTKCPKCNIFLKIDEIYLLKENEKPVLIINEENIELCDIIQKVKSTKIGNIIYFIKNSLKDTDKCIIFSQWDTILSKVGRLLKEENILPLFCTGTVYQRKRSIKSFQEDPKSRIICLSSENCASGINLTAANKIIFIEPVYGSINRRKDIENQASGRANRIGNKRPIEIVRFIIKDTVEEDICNYNKDNDNKDNKDNDNKDNKDNDNKDNKDNDNERELDYKIVNTEPLELTGNVLEI